MNNQNKKNQYHNGGKPSKHIPYAAEVCIIKDAEVTIPRDEFEELIAESTILRVVEQLVEHSRYASDTLENLRVVLDIGEHEEDEPQPTEEANE